MRRRASRPLGPCTAGSVGVPGSCQPPPCGSDVTSPLMEGLPAISTGPGAAVKGLPEAGAAALDGREPVPLGEVRAVADQPLSTNLLPPWTRFVVSSVVASCAQAVVGCAVPM